MILTHSIDILWSLVIALECVAFSIGIARRAHKSYPVFFTYLGYCVLRSLILRSIVAFGRTSDYYFYAYWIGAVIEDVLLLGVTIEIARPLFFPLWIIPREPRRLFYGSLALLCCVSVIITFTSKSGLYGISSEYFWLALDKTLTRSAYLLLLGTIISGMLLAAHLRIPWRRRAILIAAGLLFYVALDAWYWTVTISLKGWAATAFAWIDLLGSIVACLCWASASLIPDTQLIEPTEDVIRSLSEVARTLRSGSGVETQ